MKTKITVIDSIMGSGKTSFAINKMNTDKENNYIYITPYLTEVQRIKESCSERKFIDPKNLGQGKLNSLHDLILKNKNITSTHALFKMSTETTKELLKANNYILILDEVMNVVEQVPLKKDDLSVLLKSDSITIQDNGLVQWNEDKRNFESKYDDIKIMCKSNSVFLVNNSLFMWTFPIDIFNAFKEVYILTYLFNGQIQRYYYDLYNVKYEYKSVKKASNDYVLCDYIEQYNMNEIKNNIYLIEEDKINNIGENEFALSKTWFEKSDDDLLKQLKKNIANFYRNKLNGVNSKSKDNMWTTFKDYKSKLSGSGYTKGFVSLGTRATNDYADKSALAYCSNTFLNPMVKQFFHMHNVEVNENMYALSELIQWIWRSRIRQGQPIDLYIPSRRMRDLFINWLYNYDFQNS